jgi:CubicO group peptidase (beta-lactamase class C family)
MILSAQTEVGLYRIGLLLKYFINISLPVVAIILIIKCTIDISNIVTDPSKAKEQSKRVLTRLVASIIMILLPSILKGTFKMLLEYDDSMLVKYYENATLEKVKEMEKLAEQERIEAKLKRQKELEKLAQEEATRNAINKNNKSNNKNNNNNSNNNNNNNNNQNGQNNSGPTKLYDSKNFKNNALDAKELLNMIPKTNIQSAQVSVFASGNVLSNASHNTNDNERHPISSASKMMLGVIAAKMQDDGFINLDTKIDTYWHSLYNKNFNACTSEWQSYIGNANSLKKYTEPNTYLVENPATLRNCLTHSSTIKNMSMVHMVPNDPSSEYFGGGMSKTYLRSAFMLKHTSHQLFEQGAAPGTYTRYSMTNDSTTRDHALAGFTMQIAMNESINEYLSKSITGPLGCTSSPGFARGNSIYFATSYYSSTNDLAKIVGTIANNGVYNGKQIFSPTAITELERVYGNLNNQTIAFDFIDGKYVKYGSFSNIGAISNYGVGNDINLNSTYISFDPNTSVGFVVNIQYTNSNARINSLNTYNQLSNYFYSKS